MGEGCQPETPATLNLRYQPPTQLVISQQVAGANRLLACAQRLKPLHLGGGVHLRNGVLDFLLEISSKMYPN